MAVGLSLIAGAGWQFFDNNGDPLTGGKLFIYDSGTTNKTTSYTTSAGNVPNANPVVLDAAGRVADEIWLTIGASYKFVLSPATDTDPPTAAIWTKNNVPVANDASSALADLADTSNNAKGDALIGFKQSGASGFLTGAVARTVNAKLQEFVSVKDFGAVGDGVTDDTAAIQAAIDAADAVDFGDASNTYKVTNSLDLSAGNKWLKGTGAVLLDGTASLSNIPLVKAIGTLSATSAALNANANIGVYSVTSSASLTGFAEGDWVLLNSSDVYTFCTSATYLAGEFLRIRSIVGSTVTFTSPVTSTSYTTANGAQITKVDFCENITIEGLTLEGPGTANARKNGLALRYVNGFNVTQCQFIGQDYYACEASASIRGTILDNKFYGAYYDGLTGVIFYAVCIFDSSQYIDVGCNIFERARHGVITSSRSGSQGYWGQPLYINIHHNTIFDAQAGGGGRSWGFQQHGLGAYISFNNNMVNGCYGGISVEAGFRVEVLDNVLTNAYYYGVDVGNDTTAAALGNILVKGNHIVQETNEGGGDISIGIYVHGPSGFSANDINIVGNMITGYDGTGACGIVFNAPTTSLSNTIADNIISRGSSGPSTTSNKGIISYAANTEIVRNTVYNFKEGILIEGGNSVVNGNAVHYNTAAPSGNAIWINAGSKTLVDGNTVIKGYNGIFVGGTTDNVTVSSNTTVDCANVGIVVDTGANTTWLINNVNKSAGVAAGSDSGTSTVKSNNYPVIA